MSDDDKRRIIEGMRHELNYQLRKMQDTNDRILYLNEQIAELENEQQQENQND